MRILLSLYGSAFVEMQPLAYSAEGLSKKKKETGFQINPQKSRNKFSNAGSLF